MLLVAVSIIPAVDHSILERAPHTVLIDPSLEPLSVFNVEEIQAAAGRARLTPVLAQGASAVELLDAARTGTHA